MNRRSFFAILGVAIPLGRLCTSKSATPVRGAPIRMTMGIRDLISTNVGADDSPSADEQINDFMRQAFGLGMDRNGGIFSTPHGPFYYGKGAISRAVEDSLKRRLQ